MSSSNGSNGTGDAFGSPNFQVELPAGGVMFLQSPEEVELWERSHERYVEDYQLTKTNDLVLVGALLQQQVTMFRAQRKLNGLEAELDASNVPTGQWIQVPLDGDETDKYLGMMTRATEQIQKIEKALGIDKVSREAGGAVTVQQYLRTLKAAAHRRAIHVSQRVIAFEGFANDLRWRLRVLYNADAEDRAYHDISPDKILEWADGKLKELEQVDKDFAAEYGKVFAGKL